MKRITDPQEIQNIFDEDLIKEDSMRLRISRQEEIRKLMVLKEELIIRYINELSSLAKELNQLEGVKIYKKVNKSGNK